MEKIQVTTHARAELIDITREVEKLLVKQTMKEGICYLYVPHTTAAITINENADPSVREDILHDLSRLIPWNGSYTHGEGNAAAHIKSTLVGSSVSVPVSSGKLALGTWQGIYFCEFDGPRRREVFVQIMKNE
ncbi:MAG: secondary thiamine-phosphate synthase enzyme YjbQ [Candidatus Brocadia sp.]|jgi:conserved hypothetical protein TIGR00149|uniref:Secondary thiamine-phosphate synthase enzyme n=1 Tax=Candidatus Brocadia fulgida TaxID=380242 RepID=A0A0M2USJ2_9BACT|nr:MAG: hypothetical protein BROFUL_02468 [Candidatus Brocadia fulgida]OQZ02213.1 MAG: hypothetical protein B6D35_01685 [Candidatus Brocadia sp. UTAMX2]UJS22386.1 MAG: secondary thiamine-phosphate synthase enzyme YjbQ [Candidatus Brocadia sp.]